MKSCSAQAIAKRALGRGRQSVASSRQWTPSKRASKRLQRVTQWMSCTLRDARQRAELLPSRARPPARPRRRRASVQVARSTCGTPPACSTGHFSVMCWPGRQPRRVEARLAHLPLRRSTGTPPPTLARGVGRDQGVHPSARLRRACAGPDAADLLQRIVSNDVARRGESCEALILTPKGRVIAPLARLAPRRRRLPAADRARARRDRARPPRADAHRARSARSSSSSTARRSCSAAARGSRRSDYGVPAVEVLDGDVEARARRRRARAAADPGPHAALGPRDRRRRSCPAEAGPRRAGRLVHARAAIRARSRSRACTPAVTSTARCACSRSTETPCGPADEVRHDGRSVGRVTSAVPGLALAYVRVGGARRRRARRWRAAPPGYTDRPAPVAQGIERCPAEAEAASSNLAGRMAQPSRFGRLMHPIERH